MLSLPVNDCVLKVGVGRVSVPELTCVLELNQKIAGRHKTRSTEVDTAHHHVDQVVLSGVDHGLVSIDRLAVPCGAICNFEDGHYEPVDSGRRSTYADLSDNGEARNIGERDSCPKVRWSALLTRV